MTTRIALPLAALLLAACGADENAPATDAAAGEESVAAEAAAQEAEAPAEPASRIPDHPFGDKTFYTLEEAEAFTLFGLAFDMTIDETRAVLQEQGFRPSSEIVQSRHSRRKPDLGISARDRHEPGDIQRNAQDWVRMPEGGAPDQFGNLPANTETLIPGFYVTSEGEQRLYIIRYQRVFEPEADPRQVFATFEDRFGAPTVSNLRSEQVMAHYYIQTVPPADYVVTEEEFRRPTDIARQRDVQERRGECIRKMVRDVAAEVTDGCRRILSGDVNAQRRFDALGQKASYFLDMNIMRRMMTLQLSAGWLPNIAAAEAGEVQALAEIAQRRQAMERGGQLPDGI